MRKFMPLIQLMQCQKNSDKDISKPNQNDDFKQLDLDTKYFTQMDEMDQMNQKLIENLNSVKCVSMGQNKEEWKMGAGVQYFKSFDEANQDWMNQIIQIGKLRKCWQNKQDRNVEMEKYRQIIDQ